MTPRHLSDTFREEALEILTELEDALLELEERPRANECIDRVFRALHTLKGSGSMAGFEAVATFAHQLETFFDLVRSGDIEVSRRLINLTLSSRDQFRDMIETADAGDPAAVQEIVAALRSLAPQEVKQVSARLAPRRGGERASAAAAETYRLRFRPHPGIFRRGINPQSILRELGRLGECSAVAQIENIPPLAQLDPEACFLYWDIILTTDRGVDAIRDVFIFVEEDAEIRIELIDSATLGAAGDYKRLGEILVERGDISLADLQMVMRERRRIGEDLIAQGLVTGSKIDSALIEQQQVREARRRRQVIETVSGIRVQSEKLDALVDLVGELVTVQARLSQHCTGDGSPVLQAIGEEVERLTWLLRDQVLGIRMLPIGTTFSRFRRLVRDLGEELGKEVDLVAEGGETELDKTVIERLGDPLVHLIRNGIDHGIESPPVRRSAGKDPRGRIWLAASHVGSHVQIEIRDDGAGLNREAIRRRAIAQGHIGADVEIGDRELLQLIFLPGFSTADQVTSISGRGVGMDVVKRAVEALRGTIEVHSRPGEGTTFQLRLPLTLAIIDGLLVRSGSACYIVPLAAVEECVQLRRNEIADNDRRLVRVRGEIVPYVRLREIFSVPGEIPEIEQVAIVSANGQRFGLAVDVVVGSHQTVIKNLGRVFRDAPCVAGATLLGDGTVALILDLAEILRRQEIAEGRKAGAQPQGIVAQH